MNPLTLPSPAMKLPSNTTTSRVILALLSCAISHAASGASFMLEDGNSSVLIDPNSNQGMHDWTIDGINVLERQWFWYRTADDTREYSIHTIGAPNIILSDTDNDTKADTMDLTYTNSQLTVNVRYSLQGGNPGSRDADIGEQIKITNNGNSNLNLSFFQYSDFNLSNNDQATIDSSSRFVTQTTVPLGLAVAETVLTPKPFRQEAALSGFTLSNLEDSGVDNLNGNLTAGPGDVTWAFQWDFSIAAGDSKQISKDKQVLNIPEPEVPVLSLVSGIGLLLLVRKRRATKSI